MEYFQKDTNLLLIVNPASLAQSGRPDLTVASFNAHMCRTIHTECARRKHRRRSGFLSCLFFLRGNLAAQVKAFIYY